MPLGDFAQGKKPDEMNPLASLARKLTTGDAPMVGKRPDPPAAKPTAEPGADASGAFSGMYDDAKGDALADEIDRPPPGAFEKMTTGKGFLPFGTAPGVLQLPPELVKGMQGAWDRSYPDGPGGRSEEHGGILTETSGKGQTFKDAAPGTSGRITLNTDDVDADEQLLADAHTHPYSETEKRDAGVPFTDGKGVTFSGADLARLAYPHAAKMSLVRSEDDVFGVARSAEFADMVADKSDEERETLYKEIKKTHGLKQRESQQATFQERAEEATRMVSKLYKLMYYRGSGDTLEKVVG